MEIVEKILELLFLLLKIIIGLTVVRVLLFLMGYSGYIPIIDDILTMIKNILLPLVSF